MFTFLQESAQNHSCEQINLVLKELEVSYNLTFPSILRDFYLEFDGAKMELKLFEVNEYTCEVSSFIPIIGEGLTFKKIVDNDREDGFIDTNFYPLATNRGGDLYYWDAKSEYVYLIFCDDIENPFLICKSVADFFALLNS